MKTKIGWKEILFLQLVVMLYTGSSIAAKLAAAQPLLSLPFCLFYGAEILILGIYAVLWQQLIKRFQLSIAYANRAMVLVWSLLWAVLIFHDRITLQNVLGSLLVVAGTVLVNLNGGEESV